VKQGFDKLSPNTRGFDMFGPNGTREPYARRTVEP
jgi:hypothetical protein